MHQIDGHIDIYYKDLAEAIMEAENSHDLQLADWKTKGTMLSFQYNSEHLRARKASGVNSSPCADVKPRD